MKNNRKMLSDIKCMAVGVFTDPVFFMVAILGGLNSVAIYELYNVLRDGKQTENKLIIRGDCEHKINPGEKSGEKLRIQGDCARPVYKSAPVSQHADTQNWQPANWTYDDFVRKYNQENMMRGSLLTSGVHVR